jgi:large subunit ribosomal protein L24e
MRFVRRDGQPVILSGSKCKSMMHQRKKPSKLMWTQSWRRLNKKGKDDGSVKKRSRKVARIARAITGVSLADIVAKRQVTKPKVATDAATKEVKNRVKAEKGPKGQNMPKAQKHLGGRR